MVEPVNADARGILDPERGLRHFTLNRFPPSVSTARFVDRYWIPRWDLDAPYTQPVLAHPVVNVVFVEPGGEALVHGITTRIGARTLTGRGRALGIMFRPGGFRPFVDRPLTSLTDRTLPAADVFGAVAVEQLLAAVASAMTDQQLAAAADAALAPLVPARRHPSEATIRIAERIAAEPTIVRVDKLAAEAGTSVRHLQRTFADHVGANPKAVIRRYRIYEAAEAARRSPTGRPPDWAALAAELGYSDQAHLVRDFRDALGVTPDAYARSL